MRRMETSDDEEILQLLVSSDGLLIYFITEYMVLSYMSIIPLQFSNFCWKKGYVFMSHAHTCMDRACIYVCASSGSIT